MPLHQYVHRLQVQGQWGRSGVDYLHHGLVAQVGQQHETMRLIPGQNLGRLQASGLHQLCDMHKRLAVFLVGRGIHDDAAALCAVHAQVASKASIC